MPESQVLLARYGQMDYERAWEWQRTTAAALREDRGPEMVAFLQHPPVYTLGRRTRPEHMLMGPDALRGLGAEVVEVDRGGDVTFHGPGQIVAYPILDLQRRGIGPLDYVRRLEAVVISTLARFDIAAERRPGVPGAWVSGANAKIAAIGVRIQGGISTHGLALNVNTDLSWFSYVIPCGLRTAGVTSMQRVLGKAPAMAAVEAAMIEAFEAVFDVSLGEAPSLVLEGCSR